jgi:hypothetical protein
MRDEKSDKIKTDLQLYPDNAGAGPWLLHYFFPSEKAHRFINN